MIYWPVFVVLVIAAALFMIEPPQNPAMPGDDAIMRLVYLGVLAVGLVVAGLGRLVLSNNWRTVHYGMIWCAVLVGLGAAYAERDMLRKQVTELRG
ncbi:MAG: hypothetical protein AAF698_12760, partial [Pseudomonadota bacterium]